MRWVVGILTIASVVLPLRAQQRKAVVIAIDGLRGPELASLPRSDRNLPNLNAIVAQGIVTQGMIGVLPTVTAPSMASMMTGVSPAVHGIPANFLFDPEHTMSADTSGNEYAEQIRVPTLWSVAHEAGLHTASAYWPTTIGAAIDADFPNHGPMRNDRDRMLYRALCTPGLLAEYEKQYGKLPMGSEFDGHVVAQMAVFLEQTRKPDLLLVYFADLDHAEHQYGPDSPRAIRALERIDTYIGMVRKAIAVAGLKDQTDLIIVSDHGFFPISQSFHPGAVLAGLGLNWSEKNPDAWRVAAFGGGGSFGLVAHDPKDHEAMDLAAKTFRQLQKEGSWGIDRVFDREELKEAGGYANAFLGVGMQSGYSADGGDAGRWLTPSTRKGAHGYPPGPKDMDAAFAVVGPGISHHQLPRRHVVDVAPTVAALLGLRMEHTEGVDILSSASYSAQPVAPAPVPEPVPEAAIEDMRLVDVRTLEGTIYHVEGMDMDDEHIWVTSVDTVHHRGYLHQFNRATARLERQIEVTDGPRSHPGGIAVYGDSIWVPVAVHKPNSSAVLEEIDKHTLAVKRKIAVADHLGCVATDGNVLVAGNWGSRRFYVFDREGKQLRTIENQSPNQYQDMKFADGMLVASGYLTHTTGSIDWYAWPSMKLLRSLHSGATDRGRSYTAEAMALEGNDLYLIPEDGPGRLFHFAIAKP